MPSFLWLIEAIISISSLAKRVWDGKSVWFQRLGWVSRKELWSTGSWMVPQLIICIVISDVIKNLLSLIYLTCHSIPRITQLPTSQRKKSSKSKKLLISSTAISEEQLIPEVPFPSSRIESCHQLSRYWSQSSSCLSDDCWTRQGWQWTNWVWRIFLHDDHSSFRQWKQRWSSQSFHYLWFSKNR